MLAMHVGEGSARDHISNGIALGWGTAEGLTHRGPVGIYLLIWIAMVTSF